MATSLEALDATAQAELVRRGDASPRELVEAAIDSIEARDGVLNAVCTPLFEGARRAAAAPLDGPFAGVPILLKDLDAPIAGLPTAMGNRALRDRGHAPAVTTPLGRALLGSGAIVVGRSSTPEFGLQATTQPVAFGPTRNPWEPSRSVGGSSGGSAAAVAGGLVPVAMGGDGGGSIRLPAGWCGVVGLKPSRGRILRSAGEDARGVRFVITRSVRDAAGFLDVLAGSVPGSLFALGPATSAGFAASARREPPRLRVARLTGARGVDPACAAAVEEAARRLAGLGHEVHDVELPALVAPWPDALMQRCVTAMVRLSLAWLAQELGRPVREDDVEPLTWALDLLEPRPLAYEDVAEMEAWMLDWAVRLAGEWTAAGDVVLTPTAPMPPPRLEEMEPDAADAWGTGVARLFDVARFTLPFNCSGQPAISLPVHWTGDGLPVGVQLAAPLGREDLLLQVAAQLEATVGWGVRRPPPS
jgi:amidase